MGNVLRERIQKLRKERGFRSAESLAEALNVSLKTVQVWEKEGGEPNPSLKNLLSLCDLLDCDIDYLTGRIEEQTHEIKDICAMTGLSEKAAKKLITCKENGINEIISEILEHDKIDRLLSAVRMAVDEVEMWWSGLFLIELKGMKHSEKEISDFYVSRQLLHIIDDVREEYTTKHGGMLSERFRIALHAKEERESIEKLLNEITDKAELERRIASLSETDRETVLELWELVSRDDLDARDISFNEWMKRFSKIIVPSKE